MTTLAESILEGRRAYMKAKDDFAIAKAEFDRVYKAEVLPFVQQHGRFPNPGEPAFDNLAPLRTAADAAEKRANDVHASLQLAMQGAMAAGAFDQVGNGAFAGLLASPNSPGVAFVEAMRENGGAAQKNFAAHVPSFLGHLRAVRPGGMTPKAAFDGTSGGVGEPVFLAPGMSLLQHRPLSLMDVLPAPTPVQGLGGETLDYLRQTVYTNNAAVTAQLADKPETVITIERASTTLYTVAHISEQIPRQLMVAFPELMSFGNNEMTLGVKEKCEALAVNGTGSGQPTGILNASGIQTLPLGAYNRFDVIRQAIVLLSAYNVVPDAIVVNAQDFADVETTKDGNGRYLLSGPDGDAAERIWRSRVVPVSASVLASGTVIVGNFALGVRWWDGVARLAWSEAVDDDFAKNAVRVLAEQGFGFAVTRPTYFVQITGF